MAIARASLEEEAAQNARAEVKEKARDRGDDDDITDAGDKAARAAVPKPKAQRNFTDPDARIMKQASGTFSYCYNAQAVVDEHRQVIVAAEHGTEFSISTGRMKHSAAIPEAPRGRIPADATVGERMARKLKTKVGKKVYSRRKIIVEPVFGKIHTRQGKHLLLRGLEKAALEWNVLAASHNLMKLHSYRAESVT